jgi:hypothetical protein
MFKPKNKLPIYSTREEFIDTFMDDKVRKWLDQKIKRFLIDYLNIKYVSKDFAIEYLWDYSYLMMPAFKALEGTMLQIGAQLGFDIEKYQYSVGVMFNEENLNKFYEDVINKIDTLSQEKKLDIQQWLNNARRILKSLRHSPAHYNGEVKTFEKAFLDGDLILSTINYMCLSLIESGVFGPSFEDLAKEK